MRAFLSVIGFYMLLHFVVAKECKEPISPSAGSFCSLPPVVPVDTKAYTGKWYQIYVNSEALQVSPFDCATANYTLLPGNSIDVKNCFFSSSFGPDVKCLFGKATERPGAQSTSRLQVLFNPAFPPGPYNIAALLGKPEDGYYAAAVYSCVNFGGTLAQQWYMLGRSPTNPENILSELLSELTCNGYSICESELIKTVHDGNCKYFDQEGFSEVDFFDLPRPGIL